jgi:hypothetical protein
VVAADCRRADHDVGRWDDAVMARATDIWLIILLSLVLWVVIIRLVLLLLESVR